MAVPLLLLVFLRSHLEIAVAVYAALLCCDILVTKLVISKTAYVEKNPLLAYLLIRTRRHHPLLIFAGVYGTILAGLALVIGLGDTLLIAGGIHAVGVILNAVSYLSQNRQIV